MPVRMRMTPKTANAGETWVSRVIVVGVGVGVAEEVGVGEADEEEVGVVVLVKVRVTLKTSGTAVVMLPEGLVERVIVREEVVRSIEIF